MEEITTTLLVVVIVMLPTSVLDYQLLELN